MRFSIWNAFLLSIWQIWDTCRFEWRITLETFKSFLRSQFLRSFPRRQNNLETKYLEYFICFLFFSWVGSPCTLVCWSMMQEVSMFQIGEGLKAMWRSSSIHTSLKELLLATDSAGIYCIIKYRHNDKLICRENFENGICVEGLHKKQKIKIVYSTRTTNYYYK